MYPVAASGLIEHEIGDDLILFNPHSDAVHVLNQTAAAVWRLCDGRRSCQQINAEIARIFDKDGASFTDDVLNVLRQLLESRALETGPGGGNSARRSDVSWNDTRPNL